MRHTAASLKLIRDPRLESKLGQLPAMDVIRWRYHKARRLAEKVCRGNSDHWTYLVESARRVHERGGPAAVHVTILRAPVPSVAGVPVA